MPALHGSRTTQAVGLARFDRTKECDEDVNRVDFVLDDRLAQVFVVASCAVQGDWNRPVAGDGHTNKFFG
jgi:hypothetical protein